MKFKVGDRVIRVKHSNNTARIGDMGVVTSLRGDTSNLILVLWDNKDRSVDSLIKYLEIGVIPYTKISEKLHQDRIEKIEDGKIYLK